MQPYENDDDVRRSLCADEDDSFRERILLLTRRSAWMTADR